MNLDPRRALSTPGSNSWLARRCFVCALESGAPLCGGCECDFFPMPARCYRCALRLAQPAECCGACLTEPPPFDATTALADYAAPVNNMVTALKFAARIDLAAAFAELLVRRETASSDLVIPVPLSFERERERGFNQSLEIARHYARLTGSALADRAVLRVKHTPPQQSLARDARRRNVRHAFSVTGDVRDRRIAVIDDVMTTGATLGEIARVLKAAGALVVVNRVVARTA